MDDDLKKTLGKVADTIRGLSIDGVEKANSGHPGLPMGCAELGALLYGEVLRHYPKDPHWIGRDRLVLSAGHGSMWLYSCLHLAGYELPLHELQTFRQLGSKTPGHPEYRMTPGVEATTGPLGQGVANAAGMALGLKILQNRFGQKNPLFQNKVFCLCGDGCLNEGISSEASSLVGHLQLDNFILLHDANQITLDGPLSEHSSENTKARYQAYGFTVYEVDGYDFQEMETLFTALRSGQKKPVLIQVKTIIGKGSPNKAGTHKAHGSPLGEEEAALTKKQLGIPETPFYVPQKVIAYFTQKMEKWKKTYEEANELYAEYVNKDPNQLKTFQKMQAPMDEKELIALLEPLNIKAPIAGRAASNAVLAELAEHLPQLIGGSADLSGSDQTMLKAYPIIAPGDFSGRNLKFGIREFAMSAMMSGVSTLGFFRPYCGTFLVFSDYMRNAIRIAALSKYPVIYQFTHDSIFLGEDGPTHQPIEHLMALRAIPNLQVFRPADTHEVKASWIAALTYEGPSAMILSRQKLPDSEEIAAIPYPKGAFQGAYIIRKEQKQADFTIMASGSELSLAIEVADRLESLGKQVRVVSFLCWELFEKQTPAYKASVVGNDPGTKVSIEAGSDLGWYKYIGEEGIAIAIDTFGESARMQDLQTEFGFQADAILERIL
ncbi:MAG: transketolase [Chlamydiota bacterium]